MIVNEDKALRKQIDLEKEKISADLGYFADFLDYAQDEKPDKVDVVQENRRFQKLRKTPVWTTLWSITVIPSGKKPENF